ncbi:MAG: bifunctional pyr operon transcriptional regulator/uracil phosphoribosyltransferase PyrR [Candidatus Cloacimonetes bacterium]|jgi:pyrimidine operon attenuation protein/uracil phosphoribosyltransferase|nr:bifunctional pyr operon transcriptional regulator/uracil phosphoribosyltransferase PyrR [Candidatus Cloacimonadota bacterium]HNZ07470.1 bifunctional pyr operon transcriptional regulator/uracil phosphoribosyltransferase PyrR [Candidatus Cloacimonadota bacterium]HOH79066.1 bifunctional pyr operon transcriptional regulator/uracil phosphoribosyltransferase PyrR [Candidatus Cloacimonadota bacterium]
MQIKSQIMDKAQMERSVHRMAHEIIEQNRGLAKICLVGIRSRGVPLAQRLSEYLRLIEGQEIPVGMLDITLYRDDLSTIAHQPVIKGSQLDFDIEDAVIVLVDDVLFTGRTVRAAIDALMDFGRPRQIQLAVLIDRGHRELPIKADYVGKNVPTSKEEIIKVEFEETDGSDRVCIVLA